AWMSSGRLEASSDTLHERIDAARGDERFRPPDLLEQGVASENAPRMRRQQVQQLELLLGHPKIAFLVANPSPRRVDLDAVNENRPAARASEYGFTPSGPGPQQGADPRDEFAKAKWLHEIGVGTALERGDAVDHLRRLGQQQKADVGIGDTVAPGAIERQPIDAHRSGVDNRQIERIG